MLSVASAAAVVARRELVEPRAAQREAVHQKEVHPQEVARREAHPRAIQAVDVVAPAVSMTTITMPRAAEVVVAAGDSFYGIRFAKKYAVFNEVKSEENHNKIY